MTQSTAVTGRNQQKDMRMTSESNDWRSRLPDGSRSVQSVWVWRGFFFMSLMGAGVTLSLASQGLRVYAGAWAVIAIGWFVVSMWLWRKHVRDDDAAWQAARATAKTGSNNR
jgi:hypothetical protein